MDAMKPNYATLIDTDLAERVTVLGTPDDMGRVLIQREGGQVYRVLTSNLVRAEFEQEARTLLGLMAVIGERLQSLPGAFDK